MRVNVVGAGAWGTAFARLLVERGHTTTLVGRDARQAEAIRASGHNPRHLPGVDLSGLAGVTADAAPEAELHVVAVPSSGFAATLAALPADGAPVLSLTKGLDPQSGERLSTLAERPFAVLSGPNFAAEIAAGLPAAAVVASEDEALAEKLQEELSSVVLRVYVNPDLVGVELCAAAKNVIALAAGGVDGLGLGDNAKAALVTRGLAEMARLGTACGANQETFSGLAGLGDLIGTCWHPEGRNRRAGELIARGRTAEQARSEIGTVEGLTTAPVLRDLSRRLDIELPITEGVCEIVEGADLSALVAGLMTRRPIQE
jgi:glycerol-3-phosphate dehydrogenase (NAD(P)+)